MTTTRIRWAPLLIVGLVSVPFIYPHFLEDMVQAEFGRASVGLDTAQAAQLLGSLRSEW